MEKEKIRQKTSGVKSKIYFLICFSKCVTGINLFPLVSTGGFWLVTPQGFHFSLAHDDGLMRWMIRLRMTVYTMSVPGASTASYGVYKPREYSVFPWRLLGIVFYLGRGVVCQVIERTCQITVRYAEMCFGIRHVACFSMNWLAYMPSMC